VDGKIRIVIVDDDEQFRALASLVLRRHDDFEIVGEAHDGHSAIEQAAEHRPDVLLLDLMMPGMDGFEALPRIKAADPGIAVIVLTALDADQGEEAALIGASSFVEKRHVTALLPRIIRAHSKGASRDRP
jgi:DNA-binding NarL/FixJ family response regulator